MNKRILSGLVLALVCVVSFWACKKDKKETFTGDTGYFPVELGKYVVYNVDSTVYFKDDTSCQERHASYQLRYVVSDTFRDERFRLSYIINVFYRSADSMPWAPHHVALATQTHDSLEYTENNVRYIKMVYPIQVGNTWKGNAFIDPTDSLYDYLKNWTFTYVNKDQPYSNGLIKFKQTVGILQNEDVQNYPLTDSTLPSYRKYAKEVYAYNIGMVYKEFTTLTQQYKDSCTAGYSIIMRAVDHN